jgi:hypothetical protein
LPRCGIPESNRGCCSTVIWNDKRTV